MNKIQNICPACGSKETIRTEQKKLGHLTLGPSFTFNEIYYKCSACEEELDPAFETDASYRAAQKQAEITFVQMSIEKLSKSNISMALFERVFELPSRTLTRWKNGDFSTSALALLRIIMTYDWVVEVAANKFESNFKSMALIKAAANEFTQLTRLNTIIESYPEANTTFIRSTLLSKIEKPHSTQHIARA